MTYDIQKEKREAIDAGRKAISSLETARDNLNSAKNWGLVDMFGGGFFNILKSTRQKKIWSRPNTICGISAENCGM